MTASVLPPEGGGAPPTKQRTATSPYTSHSGVPGFFFQAEDGIRGLYVTRVQTCALPISALNTSPGPAGEPRAEAMFNLALAYGRAKQWAQARAVTDDLRKQLPSSNWTTRTFVQLGQEIGRASCRERE